MALATGARGLLPIAPLLHAVHAPYAPTDMVASDTRVMTRFLFADKCLNQIPGISHLAHSGNVGVPHGRRRDVQDFRLVDLRALFPDVDDRVAASHPGLLLQFDQRLVKRR